MKKLIFIIVSLLFAGSLFSQGYQYQSTIEKIDKKGFYKINLQPELTAKLNPSFSDIRIKDNQGKEIPYYIEKELFQVTKRVFKEYKIVEKIKWINGATVLFIENEAKDTINNIQLQIKNFDVRKRLELAGSDNYMDWYTIKENYLFHSANGGITTSEVKSMNFPYCDYKYYRIIIYDWYNLPINVLKLGYYDTFQENGKFKKITAPNLRVFDSLSTKQTYIKVNFNETPYFDKLCFKIEKPAYFYRNAKICLRKENKKGLVDYQPVEYINLNSNSDLTFYQNDFSYKEFYVVIENEDNPPLEGVELEAYQLNRYLITYLEPENNYKLVFKNDRINARPNYDIEFFKNRIGDNIQELTAINIQPIEQHLKEKKASSNLWVWGAIGLVALLLGYVSYKMITEMDKVK